jgi:hypothetical protein
LTSLTGALVEQVNDSQLQRLRLIQSQANQTNEIDKMSTTRIPEFIAKLAKIKCDVTLKQITDIRGEKDLSQMEKNLKSIGKPKMNQLKRIETVCNEEMAYLLRNLKPSTVSSTITQYRKSLKALDLDHPALFYLKMPKEFYSNLKENYDQKVTKQGRNKMGFNRANIKPYIEKLIWLTQQDSYSLVVLGICGLTGRRPSEVLITAQFSVATECKYCDNSLIFSGQLKTKDSNTARDNYEIPVLCDDESIVVNALARLRKMKDFSTVVVPPKLTLAQVVNSITSKTLNETAKRYLSEFFPDSQVKPYDLRALYVAIMAKWYLISSDSVNEFYSELLGHSESDKESYLSYQDFYIEE